MPCPESADLLALLQGEVPPGGARALRDHMEDCYRCREEAREIEEVLRSLRSGPGFAPGPDLAPSLLARIASERTRRASTAARWIAAAALVLIAAGGVLLALLEPAGPGPAGPPLLSMSAIEWLERSQEPSGGFSAARWGGRSEHDVGLTGLAALALLPHREAREASARAIDSILSRQSPEGRFGPDVREAAYNHGIATVAVLEGFGAGGGERLREPLNRALSHIRRTQHAGGWGYAGADTEGPNTAATCWPLQALLRARSLGWSGLDGPIDEGFRYLARVADRSGRLGYRRAGELEGDALSSMGALCVLLARDDLTVPAALRGRLLDQVARAMVRTRPGEELYRDFFIASVAGALPADRRERWRSDARQALGLLQVREGPDRGSWEPRDVWSPAGGRVYATALGALILDASGPGRRS